MIAEILSIGTELLMGQIANTDAQYLSRRLGELGVSVYRHTVVGDNPARVQIALNEALSRADIVVTTGGLGPTEDDLTKNMVAEYFHLDMERRTDVVEWLDNLMKTRGHTPTENVFRQADFPVGAIVMPNRCGTAPGCIVEQGGKAVAVLPGPPREMKDMFDNALAPYIEKKTGLVLRSKFLRVFGIGEPVLETMLQDLFHSDNPTLALYCAAGEVMARISARAENAEAAQAMIAPVEAEIRRRAGNSVYAEGSDNTIANAVFGLLRDRGMTLSVYDGLTGGKIASELSDSEGIENVLISAECGTTPAMTADREQAARVLAAYTRARHNTTCAMAVIGTFDDFTVAITLADRMETKHFSMRGARTWLRTVAASNALNALRVTVEYR